MNTTVQLSASNAKPIARRGSHTRPSPIPSRIVRSAGALVWRPANQSETPQLGKKYQAHEIEVLLVHRPRYDDWSWPKGKAEINEPLLAAGVREVEEETGIIVTLYAPLTAQRYRLGMGQTKEVYYWVGLPATENGVTLSRPPVTPAPKKEIDEARWVKPEKAREMLTRRGDRRLLDDLVTRAENGTLYTTTLAFLSHAQCRGKNHVEAERTLSRVGTRQAIELIDILSALGVTRLLSSPAQRCKATLEPYATVANITLNVADELKLPPEYGYIPPLENPVPQQTKETSANSSIAAENGKKTDTENTVTVKRPIPSPAMFAARIAGQLKTPAMKPPKENPAENKEHQIETLGKTPTETTETQPVFTPVQLESAREVVTKILAHPGTPLVVSAHPELVEYMVQPLVDSSSINVARQFLEGAAYDQTAQLTVVHVAYPEGGRKKPEIMGVEIHRASERG